MGPRSLLIALLAVAGASVFFALWEPAEPVATALEAQVERPQELPTGEEPSALQVPLQAPEARPAGDLPAPRVAEREALAVPADALWLTGRVREEGGKGRPVGGARVQAWASRDGTWEPQGPEVLTGSAGVFRIPLVDLPSDPGQLPEFQVRARLEGYRDASEAVAWRVEAPQPKPIMLKLAAATGNRVRGRLVDLSGTPVAGARVAWVAWGLDGSMMRQGGLVSDFDGTFELHHPLRGPVDLLASSPQHGTHKAACDHTRDGSEIQLGDLVLRPQSLIAGRVLSMDGQGVEGMSVYVRPVDGFGQRHELKSGPEGAFSCANLPPGPYRLSVAHGDQAMAVEAPASGLTLRLKHPTLEVACRGPAGELLRHPDLKLRRLVAEDGGWRPQRRSLRGDYGLADGRRLLILKQAGPHALGLELRLGERLFRARQRVEVQAGHQVAELALQEAADLELDLVVRGPAGQELSFWSTVMLDRETGLMASRAGFQEARLHLEPGSYVARVSFPGGAPYLPVEESVQVVPDQREPIVLQARELGGRLRVGLAGQQTTRVNVGPANGRRTVEFFSLRGGQWKETKRVLVPGSYRVSAKGFQEQVVELATGQVREVKLQEL